MHLTITRCIFSLFPLCPEDIKRLIWKATLEPRIIELLLRLWDSNSRTITHSRSQTQLISGQEMVNGYVAPYPAAFSVCKESRSATRHLYVPLDGHGFYTSKHTLYNPSLDIVYCAHRLYHWRMQGAILPYPQYYFPDQYTLHRISIDAKDVERITKLALPLCAFKYDGDVPGWNIGDVICILRRYSSLKELILTEEPPSIIPIDPYADPDSDETRRPIFSGAMKWQSRDGEGAVMTRGYLHFLGIVGGLKLAENQGDDGWKAPEIKYMAVQKH